MNGIKEVNNVIYFNEHEIEIIFKDKKNGEILKLEDEFDGSVDVMAIVEEKKIIGTGIKIDLKTKKYNYWKDLLKKVDNKP